MIRRISGDLANKIVDILIREGIMDIPESSIVYDACFNDTCQFYSLDQEDHCICEDLDYDCDPYGICSFWPDGDKEECGAKVAIFPHEFICTKEDEMHCRWAMDKQEEK